MQNNYLRSTKFKESSNVQLVFKISFVDTSVQQWHGYSFMSQTRVQLWFQPPHRSTVESTYQLLNHRSTDASDLFGGKKVVH